MRTKILTSLLLGCGLSSLVHADVVGFKADASYWNFEGYSENSSQGPVAEYRHDLDRQGTAQLSITLEHPVPLLPNAKIRYVNLDSQSEDQSAVVAGDIELDKIDYILYYELLDNIVSADVGVGLTNLEGTVKHRNLVNNVASFAEYELEGYDPLIYAQAGVKLPFTGLSAKTEALYSHGSDTSTTDLQAELQYNFVDNLLLDVGVKAGYRLMTVDTEQDNAPDLKLELKGPYIGLDMHF